MILTWREILRRAQGKLSNTATSTTSDDDIYPKLKDWGNEWYERIYYSYPWQECLDTANLTIVASQLDYALDREIGRIWAAYDETNGRTILEKDVQTHIRHYAEDLDQTGNVDTDDPRRYYQRGVYTVKARIGSTGEQISIVSSSALDITPNVVRVTGKVNGIELGENITLTGVTTATGTLTFDANQLLRISVGTSDATRKTVVGGITVTGAITSTVYAQISPYEYAAEYKWIRVSPKPKSSGTQPSWLFWFSKRIQLLNNDNDIPIIDVSVAISEGIVANGLREDGFDDKANIIESRIANIVSEKQNANRGMSMIEQFIPDGTEITKGVLDYARVYSEAE